MGQELQQVSAINTPHKKEPQAIQGCLRACLFSQLRDEAGDGLALPPGASFQELTVCEQLQQENTRLNFQSCPQQYWTEWLKETSP